MDIKDVTHRKIGAFEFAVILAILSLIFINGIVAIIFVVLAVGLYFAKKHFGGEFSLAQLYGLFRAEKTAVSKKETSSNG